MPQCPRCKGDMPLLSKICPICGYIVEGDEATLNVADQINSLEQLVLQIKGLPRPTFLTSVRDLLGIIVLILTVYFLVMAYITGAIAFKILAGVFLVILQYFLGRLVASWFKPSIKDEINRIKNEFEYNERIARRSFGKDPEVARQIDDLTAEIIDTVRERRESNRKILYTWLAISAVFAVAAGGSIVTANHVAQKSIEQAEYGKYQKTVEDFAASPDNDEYIGGAARASIVRSMIAAGDTAFAEKFFFAYCHGRVDDFDCARAIVESLISAKDYAGAAQFVAQTATLRYKSDIVKLKKLLQNNGTVQ
ncbi:MAG: hypothetical protein ACI35T_04705 [Alistipes sp.]